MSLLTRILLCFSLVSLAVFAVAQSSPPTRLGSDTEAPPQRLALLVGNSKYDHFGTLKNPKNDTDKLAAKLQQLGFQTTVKYDLNHEDFVTTLAAFQNQIEPGGIALFYYSGHGSQLAGANYLIPTNMPAAPNAITVQGTGIQLELVRTALSSARLSLIILDACRTIINFPAKGSVNGLAPFYSRGTLVAYASDEGQAADDNDTEDVSLFTKHLIAELDKSDETLCQLFGGVREAVDTASAHVQFPFVYDGVIGEFIFNRTTTAEARDLADVSDRLGATKVWTTIQTSEDPNNFAAFIARPSSDSKHKKIAEQRLSLLMSSTAKAVGVLPVESGTPPELVNTANHGERLFYEKAYSGALKSYEELLKSRPADVSVLYNYGTCLLYLGKTDGAIDTFSKAIKLSPEFPWAYFNRGVAYHLSGNLPKAIEDYSHALGQRPTYAVGYNNLALAKRDQGDFAGAEIAVQKAIALNAFYAPAYFNSAKILTFQGDVAAANQHENRGIQLSTRSSF